MFSLLKCAWTISFARSEETHSFFGKLRREKRFSNSSSIPPNVRPFSSGKMKNMQTRLAGRLKFPTTGAGFGATVKTFSEVEKTLRQALETVKGGRSAVVDIRVPKFDAANCPK